MITDPPETRKEARNSCGAGRYRLGPGRYRLGPGWGWALYRVREERHKVGARRYIMEAGRYKVKGQKSTGW